MQPEIIEYLKTEKICVLAVEMMDGSPHGATVHYASTDLHSTVLFFETNKTYRKAEALFGREKSRATVVVGTYIETKKTLQMDGEVSLVNQDEQELYNKTYLGKFPEKTAKLENPEMVRFKFVPTWWRLTDFSVPGSKKVLTSTDK